MGYSLRFYGRAQYRYHDTFLNRPIASRVQLEDSKELRKQMSSNSKTNPETKSVFLPSCVLAEIFKYAQLISFDVGYEMCMSSKDWCWLTVTHVCKLWRDTAIATEELWTYIDTCKLASEEQTEVYLKRSGSAPLSVHCFQPGKDNAALPLRCLSATMPHFCRFQELCISGLRAFSDEVLSALFQNVAPALQRLTLHIHSMEETTVIIKTLLEGQSPNLTVLELDLKLPSQYAEILPIRNLKDLCIGVNSYPPTLEETFLILAENPSLERLWIARISDEIDSDIHQFTPVQLPCLKDIDISGASYTQLSTLFRKLISPGILGWHISCKYFPIRTQAKVEPKSIIPGPCIACNKSCGSLYLSISPKYVTIEADSGYGSLSQWDDGVQLRRSLKYSWSLKRTFGDDIPDEEELNIVESFDLIRSVIQAGFWCTTKELTVNLDARVAGTVTGDGFQSKNLMHIPWKQLLSMLPNLRELTVRHVKTLDRVLPEVVREEYYGLLRALTNTHRDEDGQFQLICPYLSDLKLCGFDMPGGLHNLVKFLGYRVSNDKRLRNLQLHKPFEITDAILHFLTTSGISEYVEVTEGYI